jgi:REP element-mobilizing transposase RayT
MMQGEKPRTVEFWRGRLPHWEVADGLYFITIHLAGAIPRDAAKRIREMSRWAKSFPCAQRSSLERKVFEEMERWLDRNEEVRYLGRPEVAAAVTEAIQYRVNKGIWTVFEHVIMPSHIHLLLEFGLFGLRESMVDFKRRTGYLAADILKLRHRSFWQKEWFDHWVRTHEEAASITDYIRQNPVKAGLVRSYADWPYGSWK